MVLFQLLRRHQRGITGQRPLTDKDALFMNRHILAMDDTTDMSAALYNQFITLNIGIDAPANADLVSAYNALDLAATAYRNTV